MLGGGHPQTDPGKRDNGVRVIAGGTGIEGNRTWLLPRNTTAGIASPAERMRGIPYATRLIGHIRIDARTAVARYTDRPDARIAVAGIVREGIAADPPVVLGYIKPVSVPRRMVT